MVMCVCVDVAPGVYLCVLHVLMVCSLCYYTVVPTNWGGPPPLCETGTKICSSVAPPPPPLAMVMVCPLPPPVDLWWVWIGVNAGWWSRSLCKWC